MEQSCGNCQYFCGGCCKLNPPPQPSVEASDWCGHWAPKPMEPPMEADNGVE